MAQDSREPQQIVTDLIEKSPICMVTTTGEQGRLCARPMTRQDSRFEGVLHFIAPRDGQFVAEIHTAPAVNVSVQSSDGFVSVAGTATEVTDRSRLESAWNPATGAWFPDGPATATLVEVVAESAEYWDTSGSSVVQLASFVKSALTDGDSTPDMGTSGTVEL